MLVGYENIMLGFFSQSSLMDLFSRQQVFVCFGGIWLWSYAESS